MTIKMLIVDDEPIICRGLRETIPWDTVGVTVTGEASDGAEALELIAREPVDLVLTDIHMDGMDGLALSRELRSKYPHIRIIILSGYDDFEYARQAIRIGVEDFLLKPVDIDELMAMVRRIGEELAQEAEGRKRHIRDGWLHWLNRLLQSGGSFPEGEDRPAVPEGATGFRFAVSQLENYGLWAGRLADEERKSLRRNWEHALHDALGGEGLDAYSLFWHPNVLVTLCIEFRAADIDGLRAALSGITVPQAEESRLLIGISPVFHGFSEAYARFEEAMAAVQLIPTLKERTVLIGEAAAVRRKNRGASIAAELETRMLGLLFGDSEAELDMAAAELMETAREKGIHPADIALAVKELKIAVRRRLRSGSAALSEEIEALLAVDIDLFAHNSYRSLESLLRGELKSLFNLIRSSAHGKNHWMIDRVKKYIESRYSSDVKASEVAAWLQITPNYFSIVFNQYFGKGFAEYLNEVRIEHAKAMLSATHDRVFEIAEKVGYNDYKYFCSIFKSYTGLTPTQYRKIAESTSA
ncbi:response regulator [Paenibacillus hamazuiensis]|uniref:response regulator n=1 Tax=Paenibacillus hamazuiensis TaxID=2936508 RepID=UPI00200F4632|nr:response regulator [Paenibacillus hamazuiensis]